MTMMYQIQPSTPFALLDRTTSRIEHVNDDVKFFFDQGYTHPEDASAEIHDTVLFEDVSWRQSYVYLMEEEEVNGAFYGRKIELEEFIKRYYIYTLDIHSESYGDHLATYTGYLYLPDRQKEVQMTVSIRYNGNAVYEMED